MALLSVNSQLFSVSLHFSEVRSAPPSLPATLFRNTTFVSEISSGIAPASVLVMLMAPPSPPPATLPVNWALVMAISQTPAMAIAPPSAPSASLPENTADRLADPPSTASFVPASISTAAPPWASLKLWIWVLAFTFSLPLTTWMALPLFPAPLRLMFCSVRFAPPATAIRSPSLWPRLISARDTSLVRVVEKTYLSPETAVLPAVVSVSGWRPE